MTDRPSAPPSPSTSPPARSCRSTALAVAGRVGRARAAARAPPLARRRPRLPAVQAADPLPGRRADPADGARHLRRGRAAPDRRGGAVRRAVRWALVPAGGARLAGPAGRTGGRRRGPARGRPLAGHRGHAELGGHPRRGARRRQLPPPARRPRHAGRRHRLPGRALPPRRGRRDRPGQRPVTGPLAQREAARRRPGPAVRRPDRAAGMADHRPRRQRLLARPPHALDGHHQARPARRASGRCRCGSTTAPSPSRGATPTSALHRSGSGGPSPRPSPCSRRSSRGRGWRWPGPWSARPGSWRSSSAGRSGACRAATAPGATAMVLGAIAVAGAVAGWWGRRGTYAGAFVAASGAALDRVRAAADHGLRARGPHHRSCPRPLDRLSVAAAVGAGGAALALGFRAVANPVPRPGDEVAPGQLGGYQPSGTRASASGGPQEPRS